LASPAQAAVPETIGWQGVVEDGSGVALQGSHTLVFRLYDDPSAGTMLWEETQVLDLVDGLAEATLGSVTSLGSVDFDQSLWLALVVDGGSELSPRSELSAVPYALAVDDQAAVKTLNGLTGPVNLVGGTNVSVVPSGNNLTINASGGGGDDGDWNINGSDLTLGVSGNVGLGETSPGHKLDLHTPYEVPVSMRMRSGGSWSLVLEQSPSSVFTIKNGGSERFAITPGGRIGIGTTTPSALLHLNSSGQTNQILLGRDSGTGAAPYEDLGARLSPSKLEFTKWIDTGESGVGLSTAGIYSSGFTWMLDGISGTASGFDIGGVLSAQDVLHLNGDNDVDIRFHNGLSTRWYLRNSVGDGNDFIIRAASNSLPAIQIDYDTRNSVFGGSVTPSAGSLFTLGTSSKRWSVVYAMAVDTPSDRRLKNEIEDLSYGLDELMRLRPVSFSWKELSERGRQLGLIAQELREVLPELVHEGDDAQKSLSVEYDQLIPVLIASLQEQQKQIESQREELARQGEALESLRLRVAAQSESRSDASVVASSRTR
jgi:hypothetical protein